MIDCNLSTTSGDLSISPGRDRALFVHEIGDSLHHRISMQRRAKEDWRAWTYTQRGHCPSPWIRGGYYSLSEFCIDLLRVLERIADQPFVLITQGASAMVAAFAAVARPDLVAGIEILESEVGWLTQPSLLVAEKVTPNSDWMRMVASPEGPSGDWSADRDDPVLSLGPPQSLGVVAVRQTLADLQRPWYSASGGWARDWLPSHLAAHESLLSN